MAKVFGVVSRFPDHLPYFYPNYYEVKDVAGVWHPPIPGTIPMVSIFGDNRVAAEHPDWVQVGPDGLRGTREARYFDWDTLCPGRDEVWSLAWDWIERALQGSRSPVLRLDDVSFAREGFCQCPVCRRRQGTEDGTRYRVHRIAEFVRQARERADAIHFTLYPDPFPGHLPRRFGVDPAVLNPWVDVYVVPIYDLHYATTYWLEILAGAFREILEKPFYIELYGLGVEQASLLRAAEVAQFYADGVIIAYDNNLTKIRTIQETLTHARG